jgi:protoheme IX farnesyltransferase
VALTKPRIISLLLVTTIAPMFVAGDPGWLTVLVVAVGGYLMAGGANAVNMYLDRDIDDVMSRTRLRPIPSGRLAPQAVLAFGVALATAATWMLAFFVNALTALLALAGFYFYVFVYTRWLKRTSPQNIVIGGAAGAFPPLVGWAAVTGRVDLAAVYLFLIVFYWTPPHFWALALLKQKDYGRAGVPMAPLVWGERETMNQMVAYTVILLGLSVLPTAFGAFGMVYFASALALGAVLLWGVCASARRAFAAPTGRSRRGGRTSTRSSTSRCSSSPSPRPHPHRLTVPYDPHARRPRRERRRRPASSLTVQVQGSRGDARARVRALAPAQRPGRGARVRLRLRAAAAPRNYTRLGRRAAAHLPQRGAAAPAREPGDVPHRAVAGRITKRGWKREAGRGTRDTGRGTREARDTD